MRGRTRLIAALAVAGLCAPGVWLRTETTRAPVSSVDLEQLSGPAATGHPDWAIEGVWHYSAEANLSFGGYSAMLPLSSGRLRAFSDRGFILTMTEPDQANERASDRHVARQQFADPAFYWLLWDAESATIDPATGTHWIGYENTHAIHRYSYRSEPEGARFLEDEVDWASNGGLEAMVRLADGRFLAIPEGHDEALIWPGDPVEGGAAEQIPFANPAPGYAVTDMAQLPDGRVLLLMRNVVWDWPPFASLIAIARPPGRDASVTWSPEVILRFDDILPPENYEGIALRPQEDGTVAVWVISDDNLSAIQRTLLAKLVFDPSASAD